MSGTPKTRAVQPRVAPSKYESLYCYNYNRKNVKKIQEISNKKTKQENELKKEFLQPVRKYTGNMSFDFAKLIEAYQYD